MNCSRHPYRKGVLRIDLPSIGIKRYCCEECDTELDSGLRCLVSNDRPAWLTAHLQGAPDRDTAYVERRGTTREGEKLGTVWTTPTKGIY